MEGKLITIEGTDCSGKETQSILLYEALKKDGIDVVRESFPIYESPTGKIVGGSYLGKERIGEGLFEEGASNVDYRVSSCYFAADRKYNFEKTYRRLLKNGKNVIFDRYVESNMAHQGGKLEDLVDRYEAYQFIHDLEYNLMNLKRPDLTIFLYMPFEYAEKLKSIRNEKPDQHELNPKHLKNAEKAYLELEKIYNFIRINCIENDRVRSREDIHKDVYKCVKKILKNSK